MPYQRLSEIVKTSIIEAFQRDEDYYEVARLLNVKRTTAHGIVKRWQEHGVVVRPRGGAREATTKVDDEMKEAAVAIVERNAAYTLKQINAQLRQTFPQKPHISISTLATMLDGQLVAMKNLEDAPVERNSPDTKEERRQYATWLAAEGVNQNIVYVDECGFNLYTRRTRGRALVGQRAVRQVAASRGRNLNLLMAISPTVGVVYHEVVIGSVNGELFGRFVDNLSEVIGEEFDATVIMDNAPIHRNAEMLYENHLIKKLPPYSPMLNCIENAFSCLKLRVKAVLSERMVEILDRRAAADAGVTLTAYRTGILRSIVVEAVMDENVLTPVKCQNWHNRVLGFLPACLGLNDIIM